MFVHILIVSYKSFPYIFDCVQSIGNLEYKYFDITICENGGVDAYNFINSTLPAVLPRGQQVKTYLSTKNRGFAGGINFLLDSVSKSDAYWILNPDTIVFPETLRLLIDRLSEGDSQAIGHDIIWPDGRLASRGGGIWGQFTASPISLDYGKERTIELSREPVEAKINYLIGASMLVSGIFLEKVGRMREDYFLYCEEVEWCLRAGKAAQKLGYEPRAIVVHRHGTSTGGGGHLAGRSRASVYLSERAKMLLTRDAYPALLPVAAIAALAQCIFRYSRAHAWRQLVYGLSGWLAGTRGERGPPEWLSLTATTAINGKV
jgi:N-acetylglucosaminyl-diphospho-decaprenol L-rhamnosyltransferase